MHVPSLLHASRLVWQNCGRSLGCQLAETNSTAIRIRERSDSYDVVEPQPVKVSESLTKKRKLDLEGESACGALVLFVCRLEPSIQIDLIVLLHCSGQDHQWFRRMTVGFLVIFTGCSLYQLATSGRGCPRGHDVSIVLAFTVPLVLSAWHCSLFSSQTSLQRKQLHEEQPKAAAASSSTTAVAPQQNCVGDMRRSFWLHASLVTLLCAALAVVLLVASQMLESSFCKNHTEGTSRRVKFDAVAENLCRPFRSRAGFLVGRPMHIAAAGIVSGLLSVALVIWGNRKASCWWVSDGNE